MKYTLVILSLLLLSCEKEEPEFLTVKKKYPLEGVYKGNITMHCNGFYYEVNATNTIQITAFNGEEIAIKNKYGIASGYASNTRYHSLMEISDVTDCGLQVAIEFQGSGVLQGDSLKENGTFILIHNGRKFNGTWRTRSIRSNE